MSKLADDLDLKEACAIVARVIERTEACRDAVKRAGTLNGTDTTFLVLGADQEIAALNIALATMLLARGRVEEAAMAVGVPASSPAPIKPPAPAPVAPWPIGAQVEPMTATGRIQQKPNTQGVSNSTEEGRRIRDAFRPAPVPPRTRSSAPEITF